MELVTLLGLAAAVSTTISFLPQVVKAWRTHHTKDLSLPMYLLNVFGTALWLIYGIVKGDVPVLLANAVTLALSSSILVLKLRYG